MSFWVSLFVYKARDLSCWIQICLPRWQCVHLLKGWGIYLAMGLCEQQGNSLVGEGLSLWLGSV